jgi:type I restriction enzyme S subunit
VRSSFRLGDVANIFNGKTPSVAEQRAEGHPVLKIKDVDENSCFRGAFESFVDPKLAAAFSGKFLELDDTLILNAAHNSAYVGSKTYLATEEVEGALPTGEWLVVRGDTRKASKKFLHHWLTSGQTRNHLRDLVKGIHLYPKDVANLPIELPPLEQQKHLAAILDRAQAICRKRREALRLSEDFLRSAFLEIAQGVRIGTLPGQIKTIGSLLSAEGASMRTGPFGSDLLHSEFTSQGVPVIGIENVVTNRFRWTEPRCISLDKYLSLKRFRVFPGDVIVTIMGTTGRVGIAPADLPECISTKHLCVLTPDKNKVSSLYLWASLLFDPVVREQAAQAGKGAIMEGWNMGIVRDLQIAVPAPGASERFDSTAKRVECLRSRHEALELESEQLFGSLSSRAFNRELTAPQ